MKTSPSMERRRKKRVSFKTDIILKAEQTEYNFKGNSKDLSISGVFIYTDKGIPLQTPCELKILLYGMEEKERITLEMKGITVRKTPDGLAVNFESMDLDSYSHLKNIVRYNTFDSEDSVF